MKAWQGDHRVPPASHRLATYRTAATLLLLLAALSLSAAPPPLAPVTLLSGSLNAGCVHVTPSTCKLHVEPFTLQTGIGQQLAEFQLSANGHLVYDFRTDVSNPPVGSYTPSTVKQDFAAACGQTYNLTLFARAGGDPLPTQVGEAQGVACPVGTYSVLLPVIRGP